MLYRIAIYHTENGKRVFDHYASDEEMENLKVSPDGKVWHYQIEEFIINPITGLPVYRIINTDFSDTHEVEWGEDVDSLRSCITELEYQLRNYKAAADGTTHWCPECKMRDDRIKKLESENDDLQQAVNGIWLPEHVEKLHMEILRLTKLLEKQ